MRYLLGLILTALALFGQSQSHQFIVIPSGSNTGTVELRELTANGQNRLKIKAPDALAADVEWTFPPADAVGCWQSDGAGVVTIAACGAGGLPVTSTVIGRDESVQSVWSFETYSSVASFHRSLLSVRRARGTIGSPEDVQPNDSIGGLYSERYQGGWEPNTMINSNYGTSGGRYLFYVWDDLDALVATFTSDATGFDLTSGSFKVGGVNVIDSSRNATVENLTLNGNTQPNVRDTRGMGSTVLPFENVSANKIEIVDVGNAIKWDFRLNYALGSTNIMTLYDSAGSSVMTFERQVLGLDANQASLDMSLTPLTDNDRDLGSFDRSWRNVIFDGSLIVGGITTINSERDGDFRNVTISGTCTGCGSAPANMMTTDTAQAVTGVKTFNTDLLIGDTLIPDIRDARTIGSDSLPFLTVAANHIDFIQSGNTARWRFRATGANSMTFDDPSATNVWSYATSPSRSMILNGNLIPNSDGDFRLGSGSLRWDAELNAVNLYGLVSMSSTSFFTVGLGNFYNRPISGPPPTCTSVPDGWTAVDTVNQRLYICIGGGIWYAALQQ